MATLTSNAQGHTNLFDNVTNWTGATGYALSLESGELRIAATNVGANYQTFAYSFPSINLSQHPYLTLGIRSADAVRVRIDLVDASGNVTNAVPVTVNVSNQNTFQTFTFSYADRFSQSWPASGTVDATNINRLLIYFNPGGNPNFTGTVFFDSLFIGSAVNVPKENQSFRFNQLGFHPYDSKLAVVVEPEGDDFFLLSNQNDTVFSGKLSTAQIWSYSQERIARADFSSFKTQGVYRLLVDGNVSEPFVINRQWRVKLNKSLLKSYYFNRASTAIVQPWAEKWPRPFAHADQQVRIHSSAATEARPENTIISSSKGWYDAGDFNKYMVNSGITMYNLLSLYEHYPSYFDTLNLNIPESDNGLPDLLDECLWNLRWMITCQDPSDGSVYHKVTDPNFSGTVMPNAYASNRMAVQRGTAAALNFAAVLAQASRIFRNFEATVPGFADSCLSASRKAYQWALDNPNVTVTTNATGISTGIYGDNNLADEFNWAGTELFITTGESNYYRSNMASITTYNTPSWNSVNTLGLISLLHHRKSLPQIALSDTTALKSRFNTLSITLRNHQRNSSAYRVSMGSNTWDFNWGSNAVAGNQGMVLLQAFKITGDSSYYHAAVSNLDYVLGRNGTGYSFVTGFGYKSPKNPHHRISQADGVVDPIPGMVVGGANPGQNDNCVGYPSSQAARSYLDTYCSYSTNEPAINYTAAVAYLSNALEAIRNNQIHTPQRNENTNFLTKRVYSASLHLYPNPSDGQVSLQSHKEGFIELFNPNGVLVWSEKVGSGTTALKLTKLSPGIYIAKMSTHEDILVERLIIK